MSDVNPGVLPVCQLKKALSSIAANQVKFQYWAVLKKYFLTFLKILTTVLLPDTLSVMGEIYRRFINL